MDIINLKINPVKAREIYKTASSELKTILEASAPDGFFSQKITDRIRSYETACMELGETPLNESELKRNGLTDAEIARRKVETITYALNEGWVPDWSNDNEYKWRPWFDLSAGFAVDDTYYDYSYAVAGDGSRLCFKSDELATYAGKQFTNLYKAFML